MGQEIKLNKSTFNKNIYQKTIDTSFSQLGVKTTQEILDDEISVSEFFDLYNKLFFDMPETGDINSHQYLISRSSEYINFEKDNSEIQALQDEITRLRQENLDLQTQLINNQTTQD